MPYIVLTVDAKNVRQAFGPFKNLHAANKFITDYDEDVIFTVLLLYPGE